MPAQCQLRARRPDGPLRGRAGFRDRKHDNKRSIRELAPGRARALSQPAFGGSGFDRGESPSTSGKLLRASVSEVRAVHPLARSMCINGHLRHRRLLPPSLGLTRASLPVYT